MTYITGTVTDANPGPALYALLAPALTSAGFTLVDTVVLGSGAKTHKVWLSAAAGNAIGKDWYLIVGYGTTGAGYLYMNVCEFFDPATDLAYRPAYVTGQLRPSDPVYYSPHGATGKALDDGVGWGVAAAGIPSATATLQVDTPISSFGYWFSATRDRVIAMVSANPTWLLYAGTYAPSAAHAAAAGADLYPLMAAKLNYTGVVAIGCMSITRLPKFTSASNVNWNYRVGGALVSDMIAAPGMPADINTAMARSAGPIVLNTVGQAGSAATAFPRVYLGQVRDVATIPVEATTVRGDTVSDGTNNWVLTSPTGLHSALFKAV